MSKIQWNFFNPYFFAVLKYFAIKIVPVFIGSFVFAGAIAKYGNHDALNKAIMESAYKPSKETFRECVRAHNRLFIAEQELSASYLVMAEELQFVMSNGIKPLPEEYWFLAKGINKNQQDLLDETQRLQGHLPVCYDTLYSQLDDLGILLGISDQLEVEFKDRAERFNELHRSRTKEANKAIEGIDPLIIQRSFRGGFETTLAQQPSVMLDAFKRLADHAQGLSESDKHLFELEQKFYQRINSIATAQIKSRFSKGIWSFLLS
ncbi:hypothetical protein MID00_16370 [Alcaligenes sp. NLF5-7]|uniref:hypothetical protein n=1 Tax=Alcaligenes sp. NLF5-7 TaxID=2918755 RepID=UPI0020C22396|nr:hypothetical protein [Alcaligenes sp. NLF5-7]UTM01053.1 hypothetical protein MID00_16370 [Alcaligenes sp. NLF5-7]